MFHFSFEAFRKYHFIWHLVSYLPVTSSFHFNSCSILKDEIFNYIFPPILSINEYMTKTEILQRYCPSMNIWITRNREPSPSVNQIVIVSLGLHIQPSVSLLAKEKILSFTHTVEDIEDIFENIEDIVEDIEDINSPTMSPEHDLVYLQSNVCLNRLASPLLRELTLGPNQAATKYIFSGRKVLS